MPITSTKEPVSFRAGETVQWTKSLDDYSASDYTLTYYLRGKNSLTVEGTANGSGWDITISAAATAILWPGAYYLEGRVVGADGTFTVYTGNVEILQDVAQIGEDHDPRSHARQCRDALRSIMLGAADSLVIDYSIFGERNVKLMPVGERLELLGYYESLVQAEERAAAAARGERTGVYIRFRNPA